MASIIGLNLGNNHIRAVELERSKDVTTLLKYGSVKLPRVEFADKKEDDLKAYASSLNEFINETNFSTRDVVVGLPEEQVFVRTIKVPSMSEKDLRSSIQYEAEQYIPLPLKDVNLSFQILDMDLYEKNKMNVLLVAARKSVIEKYVTILKNAHLTPLGLEPETLSMSRALGDLADSPYATLVVNINTANTLLVVIYKGYVRLTRSIGIGGDVLTRSIQQTLSLDYTQAEEYKKSYGLDDTKVESKIYEALKPAFDNILAEIKKSKVFFTSRHPNVKINKVIVSGGTALMPGLLVYMVNNIDAEVELANPWRNIQFAPKLESQKEMLTKMGPVLATSVGLALKEI